MTSIASLGARWIAVIKPDLRDRQAEYDAFEPKADRAPHHRDEKKIEQRKMHQLDVAHREPQRRHDQSERAEHFPGDNPECADG